MKSFNKLIVKQIIFILLMTFFFVFLTSCKYLYSNFVTLDKSKVNVIYSAESFSPSEDQLESAKSIIESRLDAQNIFRRNIFILNDEIHLSFYSEPNIDFQSVIVELVEIGELSFWHVEQDTTTGEIKKVSDAKEAILTGAHVKSSEAGYYEGQFLVSLEFDEEGTKLFADATKKYKGEMIGVYMDDTLLSAPTVESEIPDGQAQITGEFTEEEARDLASKINSGALPFELIVSEYSIENN